MPNNESSDPFERQKLIKDWNQILPVPPLTAQKFLREWWHEILRNYGRYSCYAVFLGLPADTELTDYLTYSGKELEIISGDDCLIIMLTRVGFRRSGFDDYVKSIIVDEHIHEGQSIPVAKLFGVKFDQFPCLIIFNDIRSSKHILINLKSMKSDEIAIIMRSVFSSIGQALSQKKNPIEVLENDRDKTEFLNKGEKIMSDIQTFAGKTFDKVVESWIKSIIK